MMISNLNLAKLPECVCEMRYIDSALLTPCAAVSYTHLRAHET